MQSRNVIPKPAREARTVLPYSTGSCSDHTPSASGARQPMTPPVCLTEIRAALARPPIYAVAFAPICTLVGYGRHLSRRYLHCSHKHDRPYPSVPEGTPVESLIRRTVRRELRITCRRAAIQRDARISDELRIALPVLEGISAAGSLDQDGRRIAPHKNDVSADDGRASSARAASDVSIWCTDSMTGAFLAHERVNECGFVRIVITVNISFAVCP